MDNKMSSDFMQPETNAGASASVIVAPPSTIIPAQPSYTMTTINNSAQPHIVQMGERPTPPSCGSIIANAVAFILCPVSSCLSLPGIILGMLSFVENRANNVVRASDYRGHSFRLAISAWVIGVVFWIIIIVAVVVAVEQAKALARSYGGEIHVPASG